MYIDTHCHLNFEEFNKDRDIVIKEAKQKKVAYCIVPGANIPTSRKAVELTDAYPSLWAGVGCHPYETSKYPDIRQIKQMITKRVVAIGECGLDYHLFKGFPAVGKKEEQKQLFEEHLRLALEYDLPVIIHCRDAFMDIFDVLDSLPTLPKGVFHCFSSGLSDYREANARGFLVGFDGNITFNKHLQAIVKEIPLASILLETDAPYLTPHPYRGSRNEPKYLPYVAKTIASAKGCSIEETEKITTQNALALFRLPEGEELSVRKMI